MTARLRSALAVLLVAAGVAQGLEAQRVDPTRVFDMTVDMRGEIMSAMVREGSGISFTVRQTTDYELMPVVVQGARNRVLLAVYQAPAGDSSSRRLVERVELQVGVAAPLRSIAGWRVIVDGIRHVEATAGAPRLASLAPLRAFRSGFQEDRCCLCCGEACACACAVRMSCGYCCMGPCCDIMPADPLSGPAGEEGLRASRMAALLGGRSCEQSFPALATRIAAGR